MEEIAIPEILRFPLHQACMALSYHTANLHSNLAEVSKHKGQRLGRNYRSKFVVISSEKTDPRKQNLLAYLFFSGVLLLRSQDQHGRRFPNRFKKR